MPSIKFLRALVLPLSFFCIHSISVCHAAATSNPEHALREALAREGMSGIVWCVVNGDQISAGAAGASNVSTAEAMRATHRVHVGSIAKTVLALGVLRLVSEGRVGLDDSIERIVAGVKFDSVWRATHPVTVRHLLDHTAGLEDARLWHVFSAKSQPDDPLRKIFAADSSVLKVRTKPGQTFSYSNIGYSLLGMVVEQVTQTRYEQWLDKNILLPLGMVNSTTMFTTQTGNVPDAELAWGHTDDGKPVAAMPIAIRPAGQLTTTSHDMALLARFLMSDGTVGGLRIVTSDLLSAMAQPKHAAATAGLVNGYALGLGTFDRAGQLGRCHGGDVVGFRAMLCVYPAQQKAYFRTINIDKDGANYRQFDEILIASLKLRPAPPPAAMQPDNNHEEWAGQYVPLVSRVAISRYPDVLSEGFQFRADQLGAEIQLDGGKVVRFHHVGKHLLRAQEKVAPSHVLHADSSSGKLISTDFRTFRQAHWLERPGLWVGLVIGVSALGYLLLVAPILAWRAKRKILNPLHAVFAAIAISSALLYLQPFQQLGDMTIGSTVLAIATAALPIALIWHGIATLRSKHASRLLEMVACVAALQWVGTLAVFGLVPLVLWK